MTLRERQDQFIADLEIFDNWADRFNYLIALAEELPAEFPAWLLPYRIVGCQSKTCFYARINDGSLHVKGWSNSAVTGGIIVSIITLFNETPINELRTTEIDFHIKSVLLVRLIVNNFN